MGLSPILYLTYIITLPGMVTPTVDDGTLILTKTSGLAIRLAMSKSLMDKLYLWSTQECPNTYFEHLPKDHMSLQSAAEHLRFRAFASTGWTVWSR